MCDGKAYLVLGIRVRKDSLLGCMNREDVYGVPNLYRRIYSNLLK